jgi:hypothetical protein
MRCAPKGVILQRKRAALLEQPAPWPAPVLEDLTMVSLPRDVVTSPCTPVRQAAEVTHSHHPRIGRPSTITTDAIVRIGRERAAGASLRAIAKSLNDAGVATPQGGLCWHPSSVAGVLLASGAPSGAPRPDPDAPSRDRAYADLLGGPLGDVEPGLASVPCEACGKGAGVAVGVRVGRRLHRCDHCARRFYVVPETWRP